MNSNVSGRAHRIIALFLCVLLCFTPLSALVMADESSADGSDVTDADTINDTSDTETADATDTVLGAESTDDTIDAIPDILPTIYVKQGGEGDGSDAAHPMADITEAMRRLADDGGNIVVIGRYELSSASGHSVMLGAYTEPEHKGHIIIRGAEGYLVCPENYRIYLSGSTTFEYITFSGSGSLIMAARYNSLVMAEGINVVGLSEGVSLVGGYNGSASGIGDDALSRDSYIEVRSGSYRYVCGYNRTTSKKNATGTAHIKISGGEINCLGGGVSGYNSAFSDNEMARLELDVSGGKIYKLCDVDMASYGELSAVALEYTGGEIDNVIFCHDTEASIAFPEEMTDSAKHLLRYFDTYRKGDGESLKTEKIKIAFVGDSITKGTGTANPDTDSFPAQLGAMLGDAYEVGNFSEGGRGVLSDSGNMYLDSDAFAESLLYQPEVVCIMLGTVDVSYLIARDDAAEVLYVDMLGLIEKYTSLDTHPIIYLLTPTVRTDDRALEEGIRDIILPTYKKISEDTGIGYVDTFTVSQDMKHHFIDSVHPDAVACSYIATWLYNAIVSNSNITASATDPVRVEVSLKVEQSAPDTTEPPQETTEQPVILWAAICMVVCALALLLAAIIRKSTIGAAQSKQEQNDTTQV